MTAKTLMVLGTSSSVGKSLLVTALCRIYARRGWRVLPFKGQNMSNNAAVCSEGEIGRAQAVQAYACEVEPSALMNPILLKPEMDHRSQVVVLGKATNSLPAADYYRQKKRLWSVIAGALDQLRLQADLVIIEGAGSPVELNLQENDLTNLAVMRYAQSPALLVGDIDRGGIFAQILGTLWLLEAEDRAKVQGILINKFRGDLSLFDDGIHILEQRGGVPVLGIIPYLKEHGIADEDAVALDTFAPVSRKNGNLLDIAVIRLPHISNFDDFDPLLYEPGVKVRYVHDLHHLHQPQVIILPGTKSTIPDLDWLFHSGLAQAIIDSASRGCSVIGICGGYQMLGKSVQDPFKVESEITQMNGLGLLPVETVFDRQKATYRSQVKVINIGGFWQGLAGSVLTGYEIHAGQSTNSQALFEITAREDQPVSISDGATTQDGKIFGTHLHGLFCNDPFRQCWLSNLGVEPAPGSDLERRAIAFDSLADQVEVALDIHGGLAKLDAIISQG